MKEIKKEMTVTKKSIGWSQQTPQSVASWDHKKKENVAFWECLWT